ncbi:stomoxyn-like [Lucilia sericata]|uniref:stomoxyn-like n=1 Tax=Lucilia sericata TaxID=13632 RepID=UPI0018A882FD|nr:stomoxyn-like [Lucilia sericata]
MNFYKYFTILLIVVLCLTVPQTEAGFRKRFNKLVKKVKHTIKETANVSKDVAIVAGSGVAVGAAMG